MRILLLGGDPGSAEAAGRQLVAKYSALNVDSLDPGNIEWHDGHVSIDEALIRKIQHLHPAIVAVALGHYKQEQFIEQARQPCSSVKIWIGVGGALEMIAGQKRRAPRFWSRKGLEWLWRLFIEPRRWWRIFNASIVFPLVVAREAWRQGTFLRSTKKVFSEIYRQWHV
jgi:N-acetylglucosaminyldiphosphoundecaprenol N-acetyl-beta-D-mannosaminyltransferase